MLVKKDEFRFEIILDCCKTFNEFKEAVELINSERKNYGFVKVRCLYKKPTQVYLRQKYREVTEVSVKFFTGLNTGSLCYTATGRKGHPVEYMKFGEIDKLVLMSSKSPEKIAENEKRLNSFWKRVQRERYDAATWSNLDKDSFGNSNYRFYDITKVFSSWEVEEISKAFEEKKKFGFREYRTKRDFSVSGEMREDGIYRAWFSSEYSGCGNGDYYLLLNPRIAVFYEKD